jgi:hypothetical protein
LGDVSNVGNQGKLEKRSKRVGPLFDLGERVGKLGKVKKERGDIWKTHGTFQIFLFEKLKKGVDQG